MAEKNYIMELAEEAAIYAGNSPEQFEQYTYYSKILENFDEYYAKKIALKKALKESEPKTAIALFYEEYQKAKDPLSLEKITDWFIDLFKDKHDDVPLTYKLVIPNILENTKKTYAKASTTRYDPLIFDLDGDGYNIETKENGANFDLDKNGFAEKINWTSRYNFKRKRAVDMIL